MNGPTIKTLTIVYNNILVANILYVINVIIYKKSFFELTLKFIRPQVITKIL